MKQPSTGSYSAPDTRFIVPTSVVSEVVGSSSQFSHSYASLINQMVHSGTAQVVVPPTVGPVLKPPVQMADVINMSPADRDVLAVADDLRRKNPHDEVVVATDDQKMGILAGSIGVTAVSPIELARLLNGKTQDTQVKVQADNLIHYQRRYLILGVLVGALSTVLILLAVKNLTVILRTGPIWITIAAIPLSALGAFWIRSHQRFGYGLGEFVVGFVAAVNVFLPSFQIPPFQMSIALQLIGGLYVMVRGLDNVGVGLRGTSISQKWQRWFPNPQ